jgi:aminopeptidase N
MFDQTYTFLTSEKDSIRMKHLLIAALLLCTSQIAFTQNNVRCHHIVHNERSWTGIEAQATNLRSDTIDILHYHIQLDITDFAGQTIKGFTTISFAARINNVTEINLDLLQLNVDSIKIGSALLSYTYNDTLLKVALPATMNIGDTADVTVWYNGTPQGDPSGWGGFYFQSGYAYNLGVGFGADPHTYGRVWHPCFDNFVERATYTQTIGSNNGKLAYCNGVLVNDTTDGAGLRWRTWSLTDPIPTYLACVAVSNYTQVNWTYNAVNGPVPIVLAALPADTTNIKNSFINFTSAFSAYEALYYPFMWQKAGYIFVPFSSGAMEHATAITYPRAFATGSITYQTIMAHEFSHHWFGDLATCRTQEDMWLNEGWASYSEYIFNEWVYGRNSYDLGIRANHDEAMHFFHHREGWLPVSGIGHANTYGDHVYLKGADVAHTLRGYMGDSLFFGGLRYHFSLSEFKDVSSYDFRDNLIAYSGLSYLTDFFNDWVFNPGWTHFAVDSMVSVPNGNNYDVTIYVQQKLFGAPNYYTNVPMEFAFYDANLNSTTQRFMMSNQYSTHTITLPYDPTLVIMDPKNLISDAETDEEQELTSTGTRIFTAARCTLNVQNIPDTTWMRIEHHWAAPDPVQNNINNYNISDLRYWKLTGSWPAGFVASGKFNYDGRTTGLSGSGYWLDNNLTTVNGDSIILLYRANPADDWHEWPHYTKTITGPVATSKYGYVNADSLLPGEYCFANGVSTVLIGVNEETDPNPRVEIYPSPASELINLTLPSSINGDVLISVCDITGKIVYTQQHSEKQITLPCAQWAEGLYFVTVKQEEQDLMTEKITVRH